MEEHFHEKPWLSKLDEIPPFKVWIVDGPFIRKFLQAEFTNFGQPLHPDFKKIIPPNELWIETGSDPSEHPFFIENMLVQHRWMAQGLSYSRAEKEAIRVEQKERNRNSFNGIRKLGLPSPELNLRKRVGPLEIWIIDGRKARAIDPRFCIGGHDLVYDYVPANHVWLDNTTPHRDWQYNEIHEIGERQDMAMGDPYLKAHAKWSRIQTQCYHDPQEMLRQMKLLGLVDAKMRLGKYGQFVVSEAL